MNEIAKLFQDAASIFSKLAYEFENENKQLKDRLCALDVDTAKNKEALRAVARTILENLDQER